MSDPKAKYRSRNFDLLLYDEDESHKACLDKLAAGYKYIAIKHDKDVWTEDDDPPDGVEIGQPKKAHWHVVLKFPQARWNTALSAELGIKENYIQRCVSYDGSLCYLVHRGIPEKHQYDVSECIGTLVKDLEKALDADSDINERVQEVLDLIDNGEYWTMRSLIKAACQAKRFGELRQMGSWVPILINEHNERNDLSRPHFGSGAYADAQEQARFDGFVNGHICGLEDR